MTGSAATHAVLIRRLAVISLAAALIPLVVMAVRAVVEGWVPLFDAGYFAARALDVGGPHHPYVGAWSMGSRSTGVWVNNFGPLQLDLLAPFVAISAYAGTAVGTAAINAASIVAVFFAARRLGDHRVIDTVAVLCDAVASGDITDRDAAAFCNTLRSLRPEPRHLRSVHPDPLLPKHFQ